ncbi:transglutaminase domain-containing protein [Paenibacillus sp. SYP-B3998]|uniref:Transglutaminase domain-containing protein n=1 Tax=Paenibacillus sp. SYP-B3998 TaxID=2678564 RepID=A0A6G3ZTV3_9BACL|nr:transglutaminase domain-containing protein [Paenibacillus sp. SYP-B3998]NEW05134.1 transglutaminase domain-containing protein [Paenibacillus sp. SYP-B3998]
MRNAIWKRVLLADWPHRMTAIITGLFLFQFVLWIQKEDGLWLPQTASLVSATLWIVVITYMVPYFNQTGRTAIQFMLIIILHGFALGYTFTQVTFHSWKDILKWVTLNVSQIEPYIWFSFSAWMVYLFVMWAVESKFRIFVLMVASVLFFAIRDSFSIIFLWQQVAIVLFCGFSLLMMRHFTNLRQRAPMIWETIIEYPASIGVPILLIVVVTLTVGVISPTVDPILTDPYTAWKISRGESVPLLGKGISTSASTADASSGYSRDDSKLGGSFRYDYTPVMTVDTTKRTYFRGETRSLYNGKGWELSPAEKKLQLMKVNENVLQKDRRLDQSLLTTKEVTQSVVMNRDEVFPVLFGGFAIDKIEEINKGENPFQQLLWSPRQAELRFIDKENYPKAYKIITQEPIVDVPGLRETKSDFVKQPEWNEYLQLPAELPERVKQLAIEITKSANNGYDKAKLIEKYLAEHYPYTNTPDESKGKSKDFVDRFLFEIKQGYCDYYSTSMTVLTRSIGLPARWVKGYSSGASPIPEQIREHGIMSQFGSEFDVDGAGTYTVRNSDAHSWVEVYFEGYGWIAFEPTSGFKLPTLFPETKVEPANAPASSPLPAVRVETEVTPSYTWLWLTLAGFFLLAVMSSACILLIRTASWKAWRTRRKQAHAINFNQKIIVEFEKLLRLSRRKGYTRLEHETMREATNRWSKQSKWMKQELEMVLLLFERAKYSQVSSTEQEYLQVTQAVIKLKEQMK